MKKVSEKKLKKNGSHKRGTKKEETIIGCPSIVCYSETIADYWNVLLITISDNAAAVFIDL